MNAAPVKQGKVLAPVSSTVGHRTPTLMGTQGGDAVRVWGARPQVFWRRISFLGGIIGLLSYGLLTMPVPFPGFEFFVMGLCGYVAYLVAGELRALREIQVIVTDELGLTLSTWQGAYTLCWDEIHSVEQSSWRSGAGYLWIEADRPAHIDWAGYNRAARRDLMAVIEQKRAAHPHSVPLPDRARQRT